MHFVEETAANTWKATRITEAMARREIAACHRMVLVPQTPNSAQYCCLFVPLANTILSSSQLVARAMQSAPDFFRQRGHYHCPTDPKDGLVQFAFDTKQTTFDYMASDPSMLADFNTTMLAASGGRRKWTEWYPVQSRLLDGATADTVLMVDVGGGDGHDIVDFHGKFPNSGRLVLEDLGAVTEGIGEFDRPIEKVSYDFFTEQPIKGQCFILTLSKAKRANNCTGARVYFYHHIFHNWSDEYCHKILRRVAEAMTPGYSKLLISEMLVPEQGASTYQAQSDIAMMAFSGGMERTKSQWRTLLETAGFQIVEFWEPSGEGDAIIEVVI